MPEHNRDRWDTLSNNSRGGDRDLTQRDFTSALRYLERFSEKVKRFYQSGDFEEVILNAHRIKEIYQLCVENGQHSATDYNLNQELHARIERNAPILDYWWEMGIVAPRRIEIDPRIAERALTLSDDMCKYAADYLRYRSPSTSPLARSTAEEMSHPQSNQPAITERADYFSTPSAPQSDTGELLYLTRPSILGFALQSKSMIVLLVACLLSSFFLRSVIDISLIATLLRTAAVLLLLLIAARTVIAVYSEQYAVTTRTVCITKGLLLRKKVKTPIYRIAKQTVKQSLGGRLLKIGNVFMSTYSGQIITFKEIRDPQEVSDLVGELRRRSAR